MISLFSCSAQIKLNGTLIVVIPMWDGIIMTADSRISLKTVENGTPLNLGYYDKVEKLFQIKQFILGVSGRNEFEGITINKIITDFNATPQTYNSPYDVLYSLNDFMLKNYGKIYGKDSLGNKFFCCGYVNDLGSIAYLENKIVTNKSLEIVCSEQVSDNLVRKVQKLAASIKTENDIIKLGETVIETYAKETNQVYKIGGPVSAIKITTKNKIIWLQNNFSLSAYNYYKNIIDDYFSGQLKVSFIKPEYKKTVDEIFRKLRSSFK